MRAKTCPAPRLLRTLLQAGEGLEAQCKHKRTRGGPQHNSRHARDKLETESRPTGDRLETQVRQLRGRLATDSRDSRDTRPSGATVAGGSHAPLHSWSSVVALKGEQGFALEFCLPRPPIGGRREDGQPFEIPARGGRAGPLRATVVGGSHAPLHSWSSVVALKGEQGLLSNSVYPAPPSGGAARTANRSKFLRGAAVQGRFGRQS